MRHVHILCIATESIFTEVINTFQAYFQSKGFFVSYEYAFKIQPIRPFSEDINIVIKAQRKFDPDVLPKKSLKVLFQSEQYSKLREFGSMPYSKNWDLILDVFQDNVLRAYHMTSADIKFFPIGYSKIYQFPEYLDSANECSQDCYFFGARTKYRVDLWNKHVKGKIRKPRFANTDYGIEKYMNIVRSKVNVFMPGWEPYYLPTMHIMQVLSNGKFLLIVSDTPQNFSPYQAGRHFALTSSKEFGTMLKKYITEPHLRRDFEQKMFKDIVTNHKFTDHLDEAFKEYI